ncbi:MAG: Mrp/NBP35 family ATP-binding protein [Candidatus Cloacimonetes bacterium]|nr:Mrp/NBP35 family ATP-binding protein [Candidatus Cloacimonadota bacterium]
MSDEQKIPTPEEREQLLTDNLSRIKNRIVVISGKGGVGKSTVSVNLAYGLALAGKKVGILDVDIHGPSIAKMVGVEGNPIMADLDTHKPMPVRVHDNLHVMSIASLIEDQDAPLIWRGPMKMSAIKQFMEDIQWPALDYLIVDCPPGTGDEPLSVIQILKKVTGSIIVSTPQDVAFLDARKTIRFSQSLNVPIIGLIENMKELICPHCGGAIQLFSGEGAGKAIHDFGIDLLGQIPIEIDIPLSSDKGRPFIYDIAKKPAGIAMQAIVDKIITKVEA